MDTASSPPSVLIWRGFHVRWSSEGCVLSGAAEEADPDPRKARCYIRPDGSPRRPPSHNQPAEVSAEP